MHRFTLWEWVGGRYSVWSAFGLVAELTIGSEKIFDFPSGASDIDRHFIKTLLEKKLPVLMVMGNRSFLNLPAVVVLLNVQNDAELLLNSSVCAITTNARAITRIGTAAIWLPYRA